MVRKKLGCLYEELQKSERSRAGFFKKTAGKYKRTTSLIDEARNESEHTAKSNRDRSTSIDLVTGKEIPMMASRNVMSVATALAVAVIFTAGAPFDSPLGQAQGGADDRHSRVERGFEIAPSH